MSQLFSPVTINNITYRNRLVMAPMTRTFAINGIPGENIAKYYERRAASDVGLIVTEGTVIRRPSSKNDPNIPDFYGVEAMEGWAKVVERVHAAGGKIWPQLWHVGAIQPLKKDWSPAEPMESPSGISRPGRVTGKEMSKEDIEACIEAFGESAANAKAAGFDGLQIHAAHGYLIDQFFWKETNQRQDSWGGETIEERNRFAVHVIKAVRKAVGPEFTISMRVSQWKQQDYEAKIAKDPEELERWLMPLVEAGVDILDCSQRRFWEPEFEKSDLNFAGWVKKVTDVPTITVGSIGLTGEFITAFLGESSEVDRASIDLLYKKLANDEFTLAAVGRPLIQDSKFASKLKHGRFDQMEDFSPDSLTKLI